MPSHIFFPLSQPSRLDVSFLRCGDMSFKVFRQFKGLFFARLSANANSNAYASILLVLLAALYPVSQRIIFLRLFAESGANLVHARDPVRRLSDLITKALNI